MPLLTSKGKRSFTYSVIILFVLGVFALGYLFYFIPHNRKNIHKDGFLILRNISTSIVNGVTSRSTNYVNWITNGKGLKGPIDSIFKEKNIQSIGFQVKRKDLTFSRLRITGDRVIVSADTADFKGPADSVYRRRLKDSVVEVSESVEQFIKPVLDFFLPSQKTELFQLYALLKIDGKSTTVLYDDTALALRADVADSLLPVGRGSFTAGIREVTSENIETKMFYYPFSIDGSSFILSGFVDTEKYNQSIKRIPFYFVYPLVIIFLLGLIFFPVIKFYVMDSNEPFSVRDVIFFGVSTVLGAALLTILIIQFLLWKADQRRAEINLTTLCDQIQDAFNNELKKAYAEMEMLDQFKKERAPSKDFSNAVRSFLVKSKADTSTYFHFDRIAWVDSTGGQKIKAELYGNPVFTNVKTRNYIQVFETGTPYLLPGEKNKQFGWEPIYSWTNNEFNISISLKVRDTIVSMATKMYSLMQTILPAGYGFCILDEQGNVQVHSDSTRNLSENFLEKIDRPGQFRGVMASRQSKTINHVNAYGKLYIVRIKPLNNSMPFYLVTFYDEGYIAPVNIRILIFSLLFCTVFFAVCGVMWWLFSSRRSTDPLVHCKMDFLDWIAPRQREATYYWQGFVFSIVYWLSIIGFVICSRYYKISNFNVLAILVLTPINIILFLHVLRLNLLKDRKQKTIIKVVIAHLTITFIFFILAAEASPINLGFVFFQLTITALIWFIGRSNKNSTTYYFNSPFGFLKSYKLLITSLVICLAMLPASLFTWYAHNQEFTQVVKRQQLYMANQIRERSFLLHQMQPGSDSLLPGSYIDSLQLSYGIYKIYDDRIDDSCSPGPLNGHNFFEKFYFEVAENLSTPYYKEEAFATLQDKPDDSSWYWMIKSKKLHFWYHRSLPGIQNNRQRNCLHLVSTLPPRFVFLNWQNIFPLLLVVILLVIGLYNWVGKRTEQIFLTRFIYESSASGKDPPFGSMINNLSLEDNPRLYTPSKYNEYSIECDDDALLRFQKEIVDDINDGKEFYNYVWNHCTEKEKFLLYGFAVEGTINYKNTKEIIELMNRRILVVVDERIRIFSPGFRAFILCAVAETEIASLQKQHRQNSTWQYIRTPLTILLIGIAALVFFTQQGIFDRLLGLAAGITTLIGLVSRFFTPNGGSKAN